MLEYRTKQVKEVMQEYIDWGQSQGGRGGRPWSAIHIRKSARYLKWWREALKLGAMSDLDMLFDSPHLHV